MSLLRKLLNTEQDLSYHLYLRFWNKISLNFSTGRPVISPKWNTRRIDMISSRDATGEEKTLPIHLTSLLTFSLCCTVSFILSGDPHTDLSRLDCSFHPGLKRGGTELLPSRLKEWSYFEVKSTSGVAFQTQGLKMVVFLFFFCPESLRAQMKY